MASSSSASHSVSAEAGDTEDFQEEVVEVDDVDSCDEDFRDIITYGKGFFLLRSVPMVDTLPTAKLNRCRNGSCIDASLL